MPATQSATRLEHQRPPGSSSECEGNQGTSSSALNDMVLAPLPSGMVKLTYTVPDLDIRADQNRQAWRMS